MPRSSPKLIRWFRWTLFAAVSAPLLWMFWAWHAGALGVFPEERLLHQLGRFGLLLLLLTLVARPAFRVTGWPGFMAVRRQVGLWSFAYLLLHALVWLWLHQMWEWEFIQAELLDLRYLQVGTISLLLLVPLALTSVAAAQRLLGPQRWQRLHRLVYLAAAGGVLHFWMLARADRIEVWLATFGFAALMLFRLVDALLRARLKTTAFATQHEQPTDHHPSGEARAAQRH